MTGHWKICPACQTAAAVDTCFCGRCGHAFRTVFNVASASAYSPAATTNRPVCACLPWVGAAVALFLVLFAALVFSRTAHLSFAGSTPVHFCPTCEGTRTSGGLPGGWDREGRYFHAMGFAWAPPSHVWRNASRPVFPVMRCPRCHGRGLIGG